MNRKALKFGNVMLCDYVAKGDSNKFVLVNTYSGDIVVQHFPAAIPFGLYCEYLPDKIGKIDIMLKIKIGSTIIAEAVVSIEVFDINPQVIVLSNFVSQFEDSNTIEILASSEEFKNTIVLSKKVYQGNVAQPSIVASSQSSEQSLPNAPAP